MRTLGIIGNGNFGKYTANQLDGLFKIETYDVGDSDSQFTRVAESDYVVLAIPLSAYESLLPKLAKNLAAGSAVVDVCSVKLKAIELLKKHLPYRDVLSVHTLFGPSTAPDEIDGQRIIIIRDIGSFQIHAEAQSFFEKLKLDVVHLDAERHDRIMADVHALTYFVAEALTDFGVGEQLITLPSYASLLNLVKLSTTHSGDLLETIQAGNPYSPEMRQKLMQSFKKIDEKYSND